MSTRRRFSVAVFAIAISALLLHGQISSALVLRGDEFAYRGDAARALQMYRRAIAIDGENENAVDRLAFQGAITHRPDLVRESVATASAYLNRHPLAVPILWDRALSLQLLGHFRGAEHDFALAGIKAGDARSLTFAGFAALHAKDRGAARQHFLRALAVDPQYAPAARGLERSK